MQTTASGAYKIIPKTGEANDYVLATSTSLGTNNADLVQGDYILNNSYRDEWYLYKTDGKDVMLVAINSLDGNDRVSAYKNAFGYFCTSGYDDFNFFYGINYPYDDCLQGMEDASIVVFRSHGGHAANYTAVLLGDSSLMISSIYSYNTSTAYTDLSNMELVIYAACDTAYPGSAHNLVDASVMAGADCAVGFKDKIWPAETNTWVDAILEARYNQGLSVAESVYEANQIERRLQSIFYVSYHGE